MTLHLVVRFLGWRVLELELGLPGDEPADDESVAPDYMTGLVVDASGADRFMGFTNGREDPGAGEDWRRP